MLKGPNIHLRLVKQTDLDMIQVLDEDVYARGPYFPLMIRTGVSLRASYEKDGMWGPEVGTMLMVDPADDRILGSIVYFRGVHYYDAVEIGYIVYRPEDRGKGYTSEAVKLFARYLLDSKKISRVQLQAEPGNIASCRVAEKCGFKFEGTARSAIMSQGKELDISVYSLIRDDLVD